MPGIASCKYECGTTVEWRPSPTDPEKEWPYNLGTNDRHDCPVWRARQADEARDTANYAQQAPLPLRTEEQEPRWANRLIEAIDDLREEIRRSRRL